jgi:hypothetical protein
MGELSLLRAFLLRSMALLRSRIDSLGVLDLARFEIFYPPLYLQIGHVSEQSNHCAHFWTGLCCIDQYTQCVRHFGQVIAMHPTSMAPQ